MELFLSRLKGELRMDISLIISTLSTFCGFIVDRLKSRARIDEKLIDCSEQKIKSCKLPNNRFRANPDVINALKEENGNDDIMFRITLISLIENA